MITIKEIEDKENIKLLEYILCENLDKPKNHGGKEINIGIFDGELLIGFSLITILDNDEALINNIYISKSYRNQGLGDGLFRSTLHYLLTIGVRNVFIESPKELIDFLNERKHGIANYISNKSIDKHKLDFKSKIFKCDLDILLRAKCRV